MEALVKNRSIYMAAFPVGLLMLLAAERLTSFALGFFPSNSALWITSMELRVFTRDLSNAFAVACGQSMILQIGLLATIALLCIRIAGLHMPKTNFLVNHLALFVVAAATLLTGEQVISAAASPVEIIFNAAYTISTVKITWLHLTVMAAGLAGCLHCHVAFVRNARSANRQFVAAARDLHFDL